MIFTQKILTTTFFDFAKFNKMDYLILSFYSLMQSLFVFCLKGDSVHLYVMFTGLDVI